MLPDFPLGDVSALAQRNLLRSLIFSLSSNQDVVKVMGTLVLDATDLLNLKEKYEIAPLQTTVVLYPARD
ncbi:hypothetical protein [Nitrosomonas mobilis]|uniref:Uncharacterized protein n=1 Tax=Nitrosomonas mobilis TaxID=51642 RepID=A0A1G5SEU5_9PROT|nr:hypothetical protein [Nitrosomonas mobilis]SCZ85497.1 hypothetical protein NSMM_380119 [Nitrosomonas mobilis]